MKYILSILLALSIFGCAAKEATIPFIVRRKVPVTIHGDDMPQSMIDFITERCNKKCHEDNGVGVMAIMIYHNASERATQVRYECLPSLEKKE